MADEAIFDPEEKLTSLFQPDTLLSHQYFATLRTKKLEPEKRLMLAVLEDAVACFQRYILRRNSRERTLFKETAAWVGDKNDAYLFSFENICEVLKLNPEYVREGLLRWKQKTVAEHEKLWAINVFSASHEIFVRRSNTVRINRKIKPACQIKRIGPRGLGKERCRASRLGSLAIGASLVGPERTHRSYRASVRQAATQSRRRAIETID